MNSSNKKYNGGKWSEAKMNSFIKSALRSASQRWPPKYTVLNEAYVGSKINPKSGRLAKHYKCAACREDFPMKDVQVNHIIPVVPVSGFDSWDLVIKRLFCEAEDLEVLCVPCHRSVTKKENDERKSNE